VSKPKIRSLRATLPSIASARNLMGIQEKLLRRDILHR
jgi:hypothetical protein